MTDLAAASLAWIRSPAYVDLTHRTLALVAILADEGPQHTRDLAHKLTVQKPIVTRIIARLEELDFATRETGADKRDRILALTDAGRTFRGEIASLGISTSRKG